jgi:CO/xanthine dehydrogenase FAD-binding subunit
MRAFEVFSAKDSQDAVALLAQHTATLQGQGDCRGTDLLADLKFAPASHAHEVVVDISRADDLRRLTITDEGLVIGSLVTHTEIMRSRVIGDLFPALQDAAHTIGAVQTRNLGTLGGNLVTAVPSVGQRAHAGGARRAGVDPWTRGKRQMRARRFSSSARARPRSSRRVAREIIIPKENLGKPTLFLKFGLRKGQALALVNVASSFWPDGKNLQGAARGPGRRRAEGHPRDTR